MSERDIAGDILILAGTINVKRELTEAEMQTVAAAGLRLLQGLLIDIHTIATAQEVQLTNKQFGTSYAR
jgi:hypothetical protein